MLIMKLDLILTNKLCILPVNQLFKVSQYQKIKLYNKSKFNLVKTITKKVILHSEFKLI